MITTQARAVAARLRQRFGGDAQAGITLVELLIAGAFTVVVLAVAGGLMISSMHVDTAVTRTSNMNTQASVLSRSLQQQLGNAVLVQTAPKPTDSASARDGVQYLSAFVTTDGAASAPDATNNDQVTITSVTGTCRVWAYVPSEHAVFVRDASAAQTVTVGVEGTKIDHPVDAIDGDDVSGWRRVAGGTVEGTNNPDVASVDPVEDGSLIFTEQEQATSVTASTGAEQLSAVRLHYSISTQTSQNSAASTAITMDSRFSTGTALAVAGTTIRWDANASCLGSR